MTQEIEITFPDGNRRQYPKGITAIAIAESISKKLAERTLVCRLNGELRDAVLPIQNDSTLELLSWDDAEGKSTLWHSSAHILAEAVQHYFPETKFGIGPPIDQGFYYDIDLGGRELSPEDLQLIESKFLELAQSGETFARREVRKADAIAWFTERNDPYKLELIKDLDDGTITFYQSGQFVDLCRGPHIPSSKSIKAVKILSLAGAYWRGNSSNKMLTRIYAISFPKKDELDLYLHQLEELRKRDHRRLGKELKLFSFHEEGPGFPFWHHNGMVVMNQLQTFLRNKLFSEGYTEIKTPVILNEALWRRSGHYDNYKDNMYFVTIDEESYAVKPMNCPGSTLVYKTDLRSYRDLPLRMFEFGNVHRHELSGVLTGLFRVRSFTQDDAHMFCTPEQIQDEITQVIKLIFDVYGIFGFSNVQVYLSTRPEKYQGNLEIWNQAEEALRQALILSQVEFTVNAGDGAFYGPKIDFVVQDSLRRHWQLGTVQLDFSMPERFDLNYIGTDSQSHRPVMIHRAVLGSFERFIGVLLEHTAGELPLWLTATQAVALPVSEKSNVYAQETVKMLRSKGCRVDIDLRNEKIGKKIRDAELAKTPYMLIIGEKEQETNQISIRRHKEGDLGSMDVNTFLARLVEESNPHFKQAVEA